MSTADLPEISELVPHSGRMLLLSRVLSHTLEKTVCAVDLERSELFCDTEGSVPGWVGLEYMAQCVAAHAGLISRSRRERQRPGFLIGSRRTHIHVDSFQPGQRLQVTSRHLRGEAGLAWFDCTVQDTADGTTLAQGRLSVYAMDAGAGPPGARNGS